MVLPPAQLSRPEGSVCCTPGLVPGLPEQCRGSWSRCSYSGNGNTRTRRLAGPQRVTAVEKNRCVPRSLWETGGRVSLFWCKTLARRAPGFPQHASPGRALEEAYLCGFWPARRPLGCLGCPGSRAGPGPGDLGFGGLRRHLGCAPGLTRGKLRTWPGVGPCPALRSAQWPCLPPAATRAYVPQCNLLTGVLLRQWAVWGGSGQRGAQEVLVRIQGPPWATP